MACSICCDDTIGYFTYTCEKCENLRKIISLYGIDRVYGILENQLVKKPYDEPVVIKPVLRSSNKN